jgi:hypothetical protein
MNPFSIHGQNVLKCSRHTCEHALELVGIFETACFLQFGNHARLALIRSGYTVDKTFRQLSGVERLEHILILNVLEQYHLRNVIR